MSKYAIKVKDSGRMYPNIIGTLKNLDYVYNGIHRDIYAYGVYEVNGKMLIGFNSPDKMENHRILDEKSCKKIDDINQQIKDLYKEMEETIKNAKKRKAKIDDFHKLSEEVSE